MLAAVITATGSLVHCGDDDGRPDVDRGAAPPVLVDGAPSPSPPDAVAPEGGRLTSCVDRPTDLPRPPTGRLPCELLPPGLSL